MHQRIVFVVVLLLGALVGKSVHAHCEVPCGIYGDEARFTQMLEDQQTIAKAMTSMAELLGDLGNDVQGVNQMIRWVNTKEEHATKIQHTISQYFMTQRIKADAANYTTQLTAAHAVMVSAMKCKQSADPGQADALKQSIMAFQKTYAGK